MAEKGKKMTRITVSVEDADVAWLKKKGEESGRISSAAVLRQLLKEAREQARERDDRPA